MLHNVCIPYLIDHYDQEIHHNNEKSIPTNIVHTDNCLNQYKCLQNFWKLVTYGKKLNTRVIHKFAEKFAFKGPWDATGKLIKDKILRNELKFSRCANAFDCCIKLKRDLTKDVIEKTNQQW